MTSFFKFFFLLFLSILVFKNSNAQGHKRRLRIRNVLDETLVVNSKTNLFGAHKISVPIHLPRGTQAYIYRITISKKGEPIVANALFKMLKESDVQELSIAASLTQYAVNNGANESIDAYVFTSGADANEFTDVYSNNGYSLASKMTSVKNSVRYVESCISPNLYFGFENTNVIHGLEVRLEIIALVDDHLPTKFTIEIQNGTKVPYVYAWGLDGKKWYRGVTIPIHNTTFETFDYRQGYIWLCTYTDNLHARVMRADPDVRYKIIWDEDLKEYTIVSY
jgi:hypothetical protein